MGEGTVHERLPGDARGNWELHKKTTFQIEELDKNANINGFDRREKQSVRTNKNGKEQQDYHIEHWEKKGATSSAESKIDVFSIYRKAAIYRKVRIHRTIKKYINYTFKLDFKLKV